MTTPARGKPFRRGGQIYRCIEFGAYTPSGEWRSDLVTVESECAECGRRFTFLRTEARLSDKAQRRRCDKHKRPGVPAVIDPRRAAAAWTKIKAKEKAAKTAAMVAAERRRQDHPKALARWMAERAAKMAARPSGIMTIDEMLG